MTLTGAKGGLFKLGKVSTALLPRRVSYDNQELEFQQFCSILKFTLLQCSYSKHGIAYDESSGEQDTFG